MGLEADEEAADDSFRRADDEQFVVDRRGIGRIAEEVAHADEDLPLRARDTKR